MQDDFIYKMEFNVIVCYKCDLGNADGKEVTNEIL